jgi:hypothetical protein
MGDYCEACRSIDHDTCSLTPGCPCCDDTIENDRPNLNPATGEWIRPSDDA